MIKKITKLKNVGIFDFEWDDHKVPLFKKYNLLYGWNCTGKTTISRLFSILESGENNSLDLEEDSICIFQTSNKKITISSNQLPEKIENIKVLDEDFICENLKWDETRAKPILVVGKTKIDQKEKLKKIREEKNKKTQTLSQTNENIEKAENEKEKILDKARSIIKKELSFAEDVRPKSKRATLYRNYSTIDVEILLKNTKIDFPSFSNEEKVEKRNALIEKEALPKLDDLTVDLSWFEGLMKKAAQIFNITLSEKVASNIANEIGDDEKLKDWLETGYELHRDQKSSIICKFCKNEILEIRLKELDQYFDEETKRLTNDIKKAVLVLDEYRFNLPTNVEKFYKEYKTKITDERQNFFATKLNFENKLTNLKNNLINKRKKPFEKIEFDAGILKDVKQEIVDAVEKINNIIREHNEKTDSFLQKRNETAHNLELFILSDFKRDYDNFVKSIRELTQEQQKVKNEIEKLENEKSKLEQALSDHGIGATEFNKLLKSFLGREEIRLRAVEGGYSIMRHNRTAKNLSEGERNAVALIFFLTSLKEDRFNSQNGIIVIDDPVSSFDSQYTYQAFGFIKAKIKELNPKQVFLLTHNFHFFRQLREWLKYEKHQHNLYLIKSIITSDKKRYSVIEEIDPLLKEYNSEYSYLFKLIYNRAYPQDQISLKDDYIFPNVIRKLLENYLSFKIPIDGISVHKKFLELLKDNPNCNISDTSKHRIELYCQDQSHPLYQDSPIDFDECLLGELQSVCKDIIKLIEKTDKNHYLHLLKKVNKNSDVRE